MKQHLVLIDGRLVSVVEVPSISYCPPVHYNPHTDVLTVHGVKVSVGAFKLLWGPPGTTLRVVKQDDGVVTLEKLP